MKDFYISKQFEIIYITQKCSYILPQRFFEPKAGHKT